MFGIKNKDNKKEQPQEPQALVQTKINEQDIHIMPTKFLPEKHADSGSPVKKVALILVLVIVLLGAGIGTAVWFLNTKTNNNTNNTNTNINTNTNNENQNININTNTNINTNINTNTNNENQNINTNTNTNTPPVQEPASDDDNDSLTRLEEFLFKTNLNRADTDRDGYRDGLEVASLYDPLIPNHNLIDSGLVTKYISNDFGYSVLRPRDWLSQAMDQDVKKIVFLPDSETGEFFSIEVLSNDQNLTLAAYQAGLSGSFENFSLGGLTAIRSLDGLRVYAIDDNYIYSIIYESSGLEALNFKTTFEMFLKSFAWDTTNG